jgi:hypothetical protein
MFPGDANPNNLGASMEPNGWPPQQRSFAALTLRQKKSGAGFVIAAAASHPQRTI